jgi:uncharacterized protein YoxC
VLDEARKRYQEAIQAAQVHGIATQVQGIVAQVQGIVAQVQGIAAQVQGIAAQVQGIAAQVQGIVTHSWKPKLLVQPRKSVLCCAGGARSTLR